MNINVQKFNLRVFTAVVVAVVSLNVPAPASAVDIPLSFTFTGSGLGHGVGMSQIGAEGMALEGRSATEILQHFYTGTTVAPVQDDVNLRVNLLHQVLSTKIRIEALPLYATPAPTPTTTEISLTPIARLSAADLPVGVAPSTVVETAIGIGDLLSLTASSQGVVATVTGPSGTTKFVASAFTLRWSGTRYLDGAGALVNLGGAIASPRYRYGQIHIKMVNSTLLGNRLEVTDDLRLHDEYLRGIAEVPSSWPEAAMEAQVIAARSYALTKVGKTRVACDCEIFGRSVDLTYAGWAKESEPKWGLRWLAAVAATSLDSSNGLAVLYNGKPITTFFFASSGGHTQNVGEVWGTNLEWLKPVVDPWSLDQTLNPKYAAWSRLVLQGKVAKAFGLSDVVALQFPDRTEGGGIKTVMATSSAGKSSTLQGEIFRSRLALPSTWLQRPVIRRSGDDEIDLSISIGKSIWPTSKSIVLGVAGQDLATAAIAAPLSFTKKAPLLITSPQVLDSRVAIEIGRRKATKIYLVGTNISPTLIASLKILKKLSVVALTGNNRYATAAAVASLVPGAPILLVNTDLALIDSSIGAIAAAKRPILFTTQSILPWQTSRFIMKKGLPVTVIGTPESILDSQLTSITVDDQRQPNTDQMSASLLTLFGSASRSIQFVPAQFDPLLLGGSGVVTFALSADGHVSDFAKNYIGLHPEIGIIEVLGKSALVSTESFAEINALR